MPPGLLSLVWIDWLVAVRPSPVMVEPVTSVNTAFRRLSNNGC
jgi:hypothetical protein